ncbi:MAG: hypothetical protein NW217_05205 [Hyphomicrobiaceae bacterium]|nr:hypothetical protein [Hyphomicrobiaceae bacterium]
MNGTVTGLVSRKLAAAVLVMLGTTAGRADAAEPVRIEQHGLRLELAPLGADPTRAFFLARGFATADVEHIVASACLFRSAIGSSHAAEGSPEITVALADWRVSARGEPPRPPHMREDWGAVWTARGVPEEAATAFYWSLFPTAQTFYPADYTWGFLSFGLPPGTVFDLTLTWRSAGTVHSTTREGLACAP